MNISELKEEVYSSALIEGSVVRINAIRSIFEKLEKEDYKLVQLPKFEIASQQLLPIEYEPQSKVVNNYYGPTTIFINKDDNFVDNEQ